jgi:broad specificity phosphatase PhoE
LTRANETAEIVAAELSAGPVTVWEELNEVDIGPFSGLHWQEAQARYPDLFRRFKEHSWDGVPGAESSQALYERAMSFWQRLVELDRATEQNVLAVTHSGTLQWIIKSTLGNRAWMPLFPMPNCGVFRLDVDNRWVPAGDDQPAKDPSYHTIWSLIGYSPLEEALR